ncbi:MAG: phosphatase PAP2 family protein [Desulfobacterales bacterium]|nr:phosphatase PAP2 family protein [Desulfobacterales bacterium]
MKSTGTKRLISYPVKLYTLALILLIFPLIVSCGTLSNGRRWGEDATLFPGWERIKKSAVDVALEPETWAPVVCAAVIQIDNADERISEWAVRHTPVFGSVERANDASDLMVEAAGVAYLATSLATPGGDDAKEWTVSKSKGLAVGVTSLLASQGATAYLKEVTDREGPDGVEECFPSMHTAKASSRATLASRNLESIPMSNTARYAFRTGFTALAAGTAWARVEGTTHYLGDVLVGYSLGHFISAFINDAFLGIDSPDDPGLVIEASKDEFIVGIGWAF